MIRHSILFLTIFLSLYSCRQTPPKHLSKIEGKQINISPDFKVNSEIDSFVKPYRNHLEKEMNEVLTYTDTNLNKNDGKMESSLGNLLADLCYEQAFPILKKRTQKAIDFTLLNHGGIRAEIAKGNITVADAFKVMPFENSLVVAELTADKVKELFTYLSKSSKAHPISKQLKFKVLKDGTYQALINGKKLNPNKNYFVLTTDYLQNGGDNMNFFKNPVHLYDLNYKMRNAIIDYFKKQKNKHLNIKLDNRFTSEKH